MNSSAKVATRPPMAASDGFLRGCAPEPMAVLSVSIASVLVQSGPLAP
jgi:hypothetical protein